MFWFLFSPAAGGFGLGTTFGAPAASATGTQPAAAPGLNFSFGSQSAAPTQVSQPGTLTLGGGSTLGSTSLFPANTQAQPQTTALVQPVQPTALNFSTAAKPVGLTFGTPQATSTAGTTTGLTFGNTATTGGLTFGTTTSSAATFGAAPVSAGLSFGTTSSATPASTSTSLSFGATATTSACKNQL